MTLARASFLMCFLYFLKKEAGFATLTKASDSENLRALVEAGDLPGYLWKQGLFEGLDR